MADDGYITIEEEKPIIAVTVVGSGCSPRGYNICEYWKEGGTNRRLEWAAKKARAAQ